MFLVALGLFFPMYLNTFHGIRSVHAALVEMGRSYGLSGWALFRHAILSGALPNILDGGKAELAEKRISNAVFIIFLPCSNWLDSFSYPMTGVRHA